MKNLATSIPFVTGSNRGLGRALVDGLLARGVTRLYAASRAGTPHPDARVIPIPLDITNPAQVATAAIAARDATLLINNAGSLASYSVLAAERAQLALDLEVNYYGPLALVRAFLPTLELATDATIVNVLSIVSLASMPGIGGYSASKAAAWSLTQSLRGELRGKHIRVHAVFPGPIDTDMIRAMQVPKAAASEVARAILDGLSAGVDDIAPDAVSADVLGTFVKEPRAVEKKFAG